MPGPRSTLWIVCCLILWTASGCLSDDPQPGAEDPLPGAEDAVTVAGIGGDYLVEYVPGDCPYGGYDDVMSCGYLRVPQSRDNPDDLTVELAVAILHSRAAQPAPDPILYLEGGPGGSAVVDPDYWLDLPFLDEREIILLDQRGTGYSWPNLSCPEEEEVADESVEALLEALSDCRDRLLDIGVDLSAYHSAASALDVEELRLALGIEAWNLIGISYGTRLGLTLMRDFPEGIRSVVLDSVYPPDVDAPGSEAANAANAILALLDGCAADAACAGAYPDLEDRFWELLQAWAEQPAQITADRSMSDADLLALLVELLYDTEAIPALPGLLYAAAQGDTELLLEWTGEGDSGTGRRSRLGQEEEDAPDDSQGMFYSVECHERVAFSDPDRAWEMATGIDEQLADPLIEDAQSLFAVCDLWEAGVAPASEVQPVVSAVPTLLLAGEYDPVTPPSWALLAAQTLSDSHTVILPRGGHAVLAANACMTDLVFRFLQDPRSTPDTGCVDESVRPFEIP